MCTRAYARAHALKMSRYLHTYKTHTPTDYRVKTTPPPLMSPPSLPLDPSPSPSASTFLGTGVVIGVQQRVVVHECACRLAAQHVGESSRLHPAAVSSLTTAVSPRSPPLSPLAHLRCLPAHFALSDVSGSRYRLTMPFLLHCPLVATCPHSLCLPSLSTCSNVSTLSVPSFSTVYL